MLSSVFKGAPFFGIGLGLTLTPSMELSNQDSSRATVLQLLRQRVSRALPTFVSSRAPSSCCGIVGYIGRESVVDYLLEGVRILQNRGYDSCGIATVSPESSLVISKFASKGTTSDCIDILSKQAPTKHHGHYIGIAHTRWATHGAKTDLNAHPHTDYKGRIGVVHNGTITNYKELKDELINKNIEFQSLTDTEVIANLIGVNLDQNASFESAVAQAVDRLNGTWGLAVVHKDHQDQLVVARNGSPLLVGTTEDEVFVASETAPLAEKTNHFLSLNDGEIFLVSRNGIDQLRQLRSFHKIETTEKNETNPSPFEHWTLKEIFEQPSSLARATNRGGRISPMGNCVKLGGLESNEAGLRTVQHLVISGCGTSFYAAQYGEKLFQYLGCFESVRSIDASEIDAGSLPTQHAALLLLSQSGETLDTVRACQVAEARGIKRLSVVNSVGSMLARMTGCGVYLNAGREVAVASTKAFSSQVLVLALIATWFAQQRCLWEDRCQSLGNAISRMEMYAAAALEIRDKCKAVAKKLMNAKSIFVLGKGFAVPVAYEAALKIKEISYIHAEGFPAAALKHGPFALVDEKEETPVILLAFSDEHLPLLRITAEQLRSRGAYIIAVVDCLTAMEGLADDTLVVPANGPLTPLLSVIPLQLLAYEIAVAKGINPDKPRGLAKTVTVA